VRTLPSDILSVMNCLPAPREIGFYSNDSNIGWPLPISLPKNLSRNTPRELFSCWVICEGALFISRIRSLTYLCMLYCLVFLTTSGIIYPCLDVKETHSAIWILKKAEESAKRTMGCRSVVEWICPCTKNLTEMQPCNYTITTVYMYSDEFRSVILLWYI